MGVDYYQNTLYEIFSKFKKKFGGWRAGSEHLLLFQRTQVSFPASTWQLTIVYNSSSRESDALVCSPKAPEMHMIHRLMCRQSSHKHKRKANSFRALPVALHLTHRTKIHPAEVLSLLSEGAVPILK